ncbi:MAG: hypothetical protein ACLFRI_03315 [Candidatus Izemoplasmataceae bacterium]
MILTITGITAVFFFLLASLNGLKKRIKHPTFRKIVSYHYYYGALAALSAIIHMTFAVSDGDLRITGTIALLLLLATTMLGSTFKQTKSKALFKWHKLLGPLTLLAIIIHILLNSNY